VLKVGGPRYPARGIIALILLASSSVAAPGDASAADPAAIQNQLDATATAYGRLETDLARTEAKRLRLEADLRRADQVIAGKAVLVQKRAGYMYKHGGVGSFLEQLLLAPDLNGFVKRLVYLEIVGNKDTQLVEGLQVMQNRAELIREDLEIARSKQEQVASGLNAKEEELRKQLKDAKAEVALKELEAKARAEGLKAAAKVSRFGKFTSFTLALKPSGFANTWGARRSGGRRHKGTDVMASCGAPVLAVTDGTIQNLSSGGNGGVMLYLRATNGDVFFYAHLRSYAPGIRVGAPVKTGQLIAYNGNSGNARGGPCHVHFEWHPGGGRPVNPYPLLAAAR